MPQANIRRVRVHVPILLIAIAAVSAVLLLTRTPASEPVRAAGSGTPDLAMAIDVGGGGNDCDTRDSTTAIGTGCTVPVGSMFTLTGNIDDDAGLPGTGGYVVYQWRFLYSTAGLTRNDRAGSGEVGSPTTYWGPGVGCGAIQTESGPAGNYYVDCWPSAGPGVPSNYIGKLVEVDFTCTTAGHWTITTDDGTTYVHNEGHGNTPLDKEGNETLLINCKDAGLDTDGDTVPNGTDPNDDNDGCEDAEELGGSKGLGGLRNPHNFWDFFDIPTGVSFIRDKAIAGTDFFAMLGRFNQVGDDTIDPLSTPPPAPAYHTAFDRGGSMGPNSWSLLPADGSIAGTDFFALLGQFNDSCAGAPN